MTRLMLLVGILAILASFQVLYAQEMTASRAQKCRNSVIRKEWRTLADSEKSEWLGAVKCLAGIRHQRLSLTPVQTILDGKRSLYDDFSYSHALAAYSAHDNAYFLPWHRWFVHLFDTSMRETCRYTGPTPYWDWTRDHADLFNSPVFDASPEHGLGGTGICQSSFSGEADCTVATGALASSLGNFELAWPVAHGLRRNLTLFTGWFPHEKPLNTTLTPGFIRDATEKTTGDFFAFQQELTESHNAVHNFVGADLAGVCPNSMPSDDCNGMTQAFTPNDPLFWLHHAQLDRLWDKWQHHHPLNFAAFSGRFLDAQDPQGPHYDPEADVDHHMLFDIHSVPMTPAMLLDIEAWPLCYQYVDE